MTEKITITQEQDIAIKTYLEDWDKEHLLVAHAETNKPWSLNVFKPLNGMPQMDMARALLLGYEIEPKYEFVVKEMMASEYLGSEQFNSFIE